MRPVKCVRMSHVTYVDKYNCDSKYFYAFIHIYVSTYVTYIYPRISLYICDMTQSHAILYNCDSTFAWAPAAPTQYLLVCVIRACVSESAPETYGQQIPRCNASQHTLQHNSTRCNTLQRTATYRNTLGSISS